MNKKIKKMFAEGMSVTEIAEKQSMDYCVEKFDMHNNLCNQNYDCNDCWIKCLQESTNK